MKKEDIIKNIKGTLKTNLLHEYNVDDEIIENYASEIYALIGEEKSRLRGDAGSDGLFKKKLENILNRQSTMLQPIIIYPSLHHIVASTERPQEIQNSGFDIGVKGLNTILHPNLKRGSIVTLKGPPGTYKGIIAMNFLLDGICKKESVLLIRLGEHTKFNPPQEYMLSSEVGRDANDVSNAKIQWESFKRLKMHEIDDPKRILNVWTYGEEENKPRLIEMALKGGSLLPEELLEFVRDIFRAQPDKNKIRRVVFQDVAHIGTSYPLLKKSRTAGEFFLSAFVHVMRNFGVDLVITGTNGQLKEADEMVDRACELADTVLSLDYCDVFGDRYVIATGEGLTATGMYAAKRKETGGRYFEYTPGVVMQDPDDKRKFTVDLNLLKGLVGFASGKVHRPGLTLHMPGGDGIKYNEFIEETKQLLTVASPDPSQDVIVKTFSLADSGAYHAALTVLKEKPINRTVIYMLDEFCKKNEREMTGALADLRPWYNSKRNEPSRLEIKKEWEDLEKKIESYKNTPVEKVAPTEDAILAIQPSDKYPLDVKIRRTQHLINEKRKKLGDGNANKFQEELNQIFKTNTQFSCREELFVRICILHWQIEQAINPNENIRWKENDYTILPYNLTDQEMGLAGWPEKTTTQNKDEYEKQTSANPQISAVPFYGNVLMLAYNEDAVNLGKSLDEKAEAEFEKSLKGKSDNDKEKLKADRMENMFKTLCWKDIYGHLINTTGKLLDCDISIRETMSCLLLDCLIQPHKEDKKNDNKIYRDVNEAQGRGLAEIDYSSGKAIRDLLGKDMVDENSVENLLYLGCMLKNRAEYFGEEVKDEREPAVFICWYNALRELIKSKPELSTKLRVCPLPGNGFRGDWYLGVAKGSVSLDLGIDVIGVLTSPDEEYNRFAKGVGLPTRKNFQDSKESKPYFYAWPNTKVPAKTIFDIHRKAFSRSSIPGYTRFRQMLSVMLEEIIEVCPDEIKEDQTRKNAIENIRRIVKRIPAQIELLAGKYPEETKEQ